MLLRAFLLFLFLVPCTNSYSSSLVCDMDDIRISFDVKRPSPDVKNRIKTFVDALKSDGSSVFSSSLLFGQNFPSEIKSLIKEEGEKLLQSNPLEPHDDSSQHGGSCGARALFLKLIENPTIETSSDRDVKMLAVAYLVMSRGGIISNDIKLYFFSMKGSLYVLYRNISQPQQMRSRL